MNKNMNSFSEYKLDTDYDGNLTLEEMSAIANYFHEDIYHDGILIATTSKSTTENFKEVVGKTFEEAAVEFILSKSTNNTILNGIENFVKETGHEDYARYIGFIVGELYWDKVEN